MPLITWTRDCSVNVGIIDRQHKKLVGAINDLHAGLRDGKGAEVTPAVFDKLLKYINNHFATEEELMQDLDYPGYKEHKEEHQLCVKKVLWLKFQFEHGTPEGVPLELSLFLADWLHRHMLGMDMKYKKFFNNHGIY